MTAPPVLQGHIFHNGGPDDGGFWKQAGKVIVDVALAAAPAALHLLQEYANAQAERIYPLQPLPSRSSLAGPWSYEEPALELGPRIPTLKPVSWLGRATKTQDMSANNFSPFKPHRLPALQPTPHPQSVSYRGVPIRAEDLEHVFLTDMTYTGLGASPLTEQELQHWNLVRDVHLPRVAKHALENANVYHELLKRDLKPRHSVQTSGVNQSFSPELTRITSPQRYKPLPIPPLLVVSGVEIPDGLRADVAYANRQYYKRYGKNLPQKVLIRWVRQESFPIGERNYGKNTFNSPLYIQQFKGFDPFLHWQSAQGQPVVVGFGTLDFTKGKPNNLYNKLLERAKTEKKPQVRILKNQITNYSFSDLFHTDEARVFGNITVVMNGLLSVNQEGKWFYKGTIEPGPTVQRDIYPYSDGYYGDVFNFNKAKRGLFGEGVVRSVRILPGVSYLIFFTHEKIKVFIQGA